MLQRTRLLLLVEGATFLVAASVHAGLLVSGYEHPEAQTAETVIAVALLGGAGLTLLWPTAARSIGLAVQGFALLGTCVGIAMVAIGVGPRTVPDVIYHAGILTMLVYGLVVTARARMIQV